jgi:hypothetical protein
MRTNKILIVLLLFSFFSCKKEKINDTETSTVYLNQALAEIRTLNNISNTPGTFIEEDDIVTNIIDISDFSTLNLNQFSTAVSAPIDETVTVNTSLESVFIIKKNGDQIPPFFESSQVGGIFEEAGTNNKWREFLFNFTYPSNANPISIGNIDRVELIYTFEYKNLSDETVHVKTFNNTIIFEGGSTSSDCSQEIQSVNFSNITFGDACGSPSSIRLFYTNTSNTSISIRFTVVDENGEWSGQNLGFILDPGETTNQHFCTPKIVNNTFCYQILIKDVNSTCEFSDTDTIPVCNGF